jgi:hypothetical protein
MANVNFQRILLKRAFIDFRHLLQKNREKSVNFSSNKIKPIIALFFPFSQNCFIFNQSDNFKIQVSCTLVKKN